MTPTKIPANLQIKALREALNASRAEVRALRASTSWRITAPLRKAMSLVRGSPMPHQGGESVPQSPEPLDEPAPPELSARLGSLQEWRDWRDAHSAELVPGSGARAAAHALRHGLVTPLFGEAAAEDVTLVGDEPREGLVAFGLNARLRATLAVMAKHPRVDEIWTLRIYGHEAQTSFALALRGRYARYLGSEYAKDAEAEAAMWPVPAVDIGRSPFPNESFDLVVSNEVLEHVPDLDAALRETRRILAPGGWFVATFPFDWEAAVTSTRARLDAMGAVEHLAPPEYHGNPVDPAGGSLVFQIPGWDVLARCRSAGFREARMHFISSPGCGICARDIPGVFVLLAEV